MQRRQHRSRRNAKGLERKLRSKDDQNDREKSGGVLEPPRLTKRRRLQTAQIFADSSIAASERLAVGSFKSRRGFLGLPAALRQKYRALKNPKMPVMTVRIKRISAKFMALNGFVLPCPIAFLFVYRNSQTSSALTPSFLSITYYFSSTSKIARKASCGISTLPTCFIRFYQPSAFRAACAYA